ncbi:MAG: alpha/beta hydrolase [Nitrolancea sp.]
MTTSRTLSNETNQEQFVRANGIDVHYYEAGSGPDLLLIHGGMVSANPIWTGIPVAYATYMDEFAEHFHVIAPDTRGAGRTVNPSGRPVSFEELADDVAALIDALSLDRPAICGFSEGGITATMVGIRHPNRVGAIVNDAGIDHFNPKSLSFSNLRQILGGSPTATKADPSAMEQMFRSSAEMSAVFDVMVADHDGGQGTGHWKKYIEYAFDRSTQPSEFTVEDLGKISAPMLILIGDRDEHFNLPEDAVRAYRALPCGELSILPNVGHLISPAKVQLAIDFLKRHGT